MPLERDQVANCEHGPPREAEATPCRLAVVRMEQSQIHSVAQNANPVAADAELDQPALQPARYRYQTIGLARCPANPGARHRVLSDDVEIAASGGDNDRATEGASDQNGRDAVRIKIMTIDQIEVAAAPDLPAQKRQHRGAKRERSCAHPDPGQYGIARMLDLQPVAGFLARDPGKNGIPPEPSGREREPGAGRDNTGGDSTARNEFPQARLDENPVLGLQQVGI